MNNPALDFLLVDGEVSFYGQGLSNKGLDFQLIKNFKLTKDFDLGALTRTAWFDYRFMHPMLRVFYFTHLLKKVVSKHYTAKGKFWVALKIGRATSLFPTLKQSDITCIFTACFVADNFGIPYDFWLEHFIEKILSTLKPFNYYMLYNQEIVDYILNKWEERNQSGIYLAHSSAYLSYNHFDNPFADEYQEYLCSKINNKENRNFYLRVLIKNNQHLSEEFAIKKYGEEKIKDL